MQGPVARLTTADPEMPRAGHPPGLGELSWEAGVCHPGPEGGFNPHPSALSPGIAFLNSQD